MLELIYLYLQYEWIRIDVNKEMEFVYWNEISAYLLQGILTIPDQSKEKILIEMDFSPNIRPIFY